MPELVLGGGVDAVRVARRFVADTLVDAPSEQRDDAELVVTELVTNAVLHGDPPVTLRVAIEANGVRLEVGDAGRQVPIRVRAGAGAMTGRGLALVEALATSWGVEAGASGGKVVWAQVGMPGAPADDVSMTDADLDALLASFDDLDDAEPTYVVELGTVPTDLLLDAKAHMDNLVREFTLAASGAEAPGAATLPDQLQPLIETVVGEFADARAQIKQQAVASWSRGDAHTTLRLTLPASAATAGERYLAALDGADRFARTARLLTLEAPPVHRVFRRWYVQSLVDQLRAAAAGSPPPAAPTFEQALARELAELAPLREVASRLELLQRVTADLTGAATVEEIVDLVCSSAYGVLGAKAARIYLLTPDRTLRSYATVGGDPRIAAAYDEISVDADLPGGVALRTRRTVVTRGRDELAALFPLLADVYAEERTLLVAPLVVGDHDIGVLSLSFEGSDAIEGETQAAFLTTLADVTAQALERALAAAAAAAASERLAFLADASLVLSSSVASHTVLASLAKLVVPRAADWCVIQLLVEGVLETVALVHSDQRKVEWALDTQARYPTDMDSPTGAPNVIRTGRSELYPEIPQELIAAGAVDADHLRLLEEFGLRSALVVPLVGRTGVIGALTLIYAESGRRYSDEDVVFMEDLARRAALAVETAHRYETQRGRLETVERVAEAAQHAILATLPRRLRNVALSARYVSAAAESLVGGDLYEVVERDAAVRVLVGDVRGKGLEAVRLATVVLGEFRAAAAELDDLRAVARKIDQRLRRYLGDEDFVTAVLAEIGDDGSYSIVHCGHPAVLLASEGRVAETSAPPTLPLGLGADPQRIDGVLREGDRLLLYTDGIVEARDADGRFVDLAALSAVIAEEPLERVLDRILDTLREAVGGDLADDLALVAAEYVGPPSVATVAATSAGGVEVPSAT